MKSDEIKLLRKRLGLTQNEFGHMFAVTGSIVTLWEKGVRVPDMYKQLSMIKIKEKLDKEKIGLENMSIYESEKKTEIKNMLLLGGAMAIIIWALNKD